MRFANLRLSSWIPPLTALVLLPCAVALERRCDWTPGAACLLLLLIPVCVASLADSPWGLLLTTLVGTSSILHEGFLDWPANGEFLEAPAFPFVASGLLVIIGPLLRQLVYLKHDITAISPVPDLARHSEIPIFEVVERQAPDTSSTESQASGAAITELLVQSELESPPELATPLQLQESIESEDPQLLLTLQEVGWRVATDFDLATLYQTVRHTTQRILRCQRCSVLLWNSQDSTLVDALHNSEVSEAPIAYPNRGMLGWVAKNRNLLVRSDVENDPALKYLQRRDECHIEAVVPLTAGGELLGLLTLEGVNASTPQFRRMLQLLANVSALAIKNARLFQRIAEMARRDGLTGLLNHASFQERLRELVDAAQCKQLPLTVIMSDVDRFKSINDTYGHPVGDHVLREVGRIWRTVVPEYALSARYGGEEFICAIPGMGLERASDLAEALRHTIETLPLSFERGVISVTASFGVAQLGLPARNATELVRLVDEALYQSKRGGRNCVTLVPATRQATNQEQVPV
ncbi:MAG: diguanylate cyclase [Planctomycetaceae bacterium]|nr:diguanylate cyclase [Planctomycetaceae bacterium]